MEAEVGISFSKVSMPNSGMNIGFTGTIIYWLCEALMIACVATGLVWTASSKPFCTECDLWCHEKRLGELSVNSQRVKLLIENGRIESLSRELPGYELTRLMLYRCPRCQTPDRSVVRIYRVSYYNNNEQLKHLGSFILPDTMIRQLSGLMSDARDDLAVLHAVEEINDELRLLTAVQSPVERDSNGEVEEYMARLLKEQGDRRPVQS